MCVGGVNIYILVDSGATVSIWSKCNNLNATLSVGVLKTVGASGIPMVENLTKHLLSPTPDKMLNHNFVYSPNCPVKWTGRDLLCKWGINICCSEKGLVVTTPSIGIYTTLEVPGHDWYYSWFSLTPLTHWKHLLDPDQTKPNHLHCTDKFSRRDYLFEPLWGIERQNRKSEGIVAVFS